MRANSFKINSKTLYLTACIVCVFFPLRYSGKANFEKPIYFSHPTLWLSCSKFANKTFSFFFFAGLKVVGSRSITVFSLEKSLAIFAKIAILQGATIGIQLKLSEAGDFSPFLPFSPLHAILDLSGNGGAFWWFVFVIVFLYILKQVSSKNFKPYIWWQTF